MIKTVKSPRLFVRGVISLSKDETKGSLIRPYELMSLTSGYQARGKRKEQRDETGLRESHLRALTTF